MEGMQLVAEDYSTSDIIKAIQKCDTLFRTDTAKIAKILKRSSDLQTVKAVFDFLLSRVKYKLDVPGVQLARRPNRTLQEGRGDCKSFSLLAGSLLYNLGYDYSYRFVSYRPDPTPTHVYVIAHTKQGDVLVDGVWKIFNDQKPYRTKTDIRMKGLYIGATEDINIIRKKKRPQWRLTLIQANEMLLDPNLKGRRRRAWEGKRDMMRANLGYPKITGVAINGL